MINLLDRLITEFTLRNVFLANPFSVLIGVTEPMCKLTERHTHEQIKAIFLYDPSTGKLRFRDMTLKNKHPYQKKAHHSGYMNVDIKRYKYLQHRVAYYIHHGYLPPMLDHINHNKLDNRIANLRPATASNNCANRTLKKAKNGNAFKGVNQLPSGNWQASAGHKYLGAFPTQKEAAEAYDKAVILKYGAFACTNKSLGLY